MRTTRTVPEKKCTAALHIDEGLSLHLSAPFLAPEPPYLSAEALLPFSLQ